MDALFIVESFSNTLYTQGHTLAINLKSRAYTLSVYKYLTNKANTQAS